MLIYEHFQGDDSYWKPYLDVLPGDDDFDTLMYWTEPELAELQASAITDKIGRIEAEEAFIRDVFPVIEENVDTFYPPQIPLSERLNKKQLMRLAHRMASTIMAYAFDLDDDQNLNTSHEDGYVTDEEQINLPKFMVPMADMLNADVDFNAHVFNEENSLVMRSTRPIVKGEEILNDYGPLPRAELLRRYGYITEKYEKYDVVEVPLDLVVSAITGFLEMPQEDVDKRIEALFEDDIAQDGFIIERMEETPETSQAHSYSHDTYPLLVRIPDELFEVLQTLLADTSIWRKWRKKADAQKQLELRTRADQLLVDVLARRLKQYKTISIEDDQILKSDLLSKRQRYAVEIRLAEKHLLQEAKRTAQTSMISSAEDAHKDVEGQPAEKRRKLD